MATLEKIRNKAGLLVSIIIGLALLAFILGDFLKPGKSMFRSNEMIVGKVAGEKIMYNYFLEQTQKTEDIYKFNSGKTTLDESTLEGLREQTWQQMIEQNIMTKQYEKLGLVVSPQEVYDMVQGNNPHSIVVQLFSNPETKQFNKGVVLQFLKTMDQDNTGQRKAFWIYLENEIIREKMMSKYSTLIKKGLYVTSEQVKAEINEASKLVDFKFISQSYTSVSDSSITFTQSDLEDYLEEHSQLYEQEPSRDIQYVVFDVIPSNDDYILAEKTINKLKEEFETTTDIKLFINHSSDSPFDEKYYKQNELPDTLKKLMFTVTKGTCFGPYFENNSFKIARLADVEMIPDSVKARHILIRPKTQSKEDVDAAKAIGDSLKNVIKKGGDFAALAKQFSTDGTADKGGDLGWFNEGTMVKPFNDACFFGKKGDVMVVESQFGVHVVELLEKGKEVKKVRVGILDIKVIPSQVTFQLMYKKAGMFAASINNGENFDENANKLNLQIRTANQVSPNMREINGLPKSRDLVRWIFGAEKGQISKIFEYDDKFVLAKLTEVREKGVSSLDQVKDKIELAVKKEKKAAKIIENLNAKLVNVKTIEALSQALNVPVQEANDVNFNFGYIPGSGSETNLCAAAFVLTPQKLSVPVKGENGVYVLYVNNVKNNVEANTEMLKTRLNSSYQSRASYEVYDVLKKIANVEDNRSKFF